ncbi:MAG: hypothetical protein ACJARL_000852 [Halopseudomonas sp.]|jgi:hypothetical protein
MHPPFLSFIQTPASTNIASADHIQFTVSRTAAPRFQGASCAIFMYQRFRRQIIIGRALTRLGSTGQPCVVDLIGRFIQTSSRIAIDRPCRTTLLLALVIRPYLRWYRIPTAVCINLLWLKLVIFAHVPVLLIG